MAIKVNMSKRSITRAILDDLDINIGNEPRSEHHHDELIEKVLAGLLPVTEPVSAVYSTLQWLETHDIVTFEPDDKNKTYSPPDEWK